VCVNFCQNSDGDMAANAQLWWCALYIMHFEHNPVEMTKLMGCSVSLFFSDLKTDYCLLLIHASMP